METWEIVVGWAEEAYKTVMGVEKWNSLTVQQKHDAVMIILKTMDKALEKVGV